MDEPEARVGRLAEAIERMPADSSVAPRDLDSFWIDCVRLSLSGWVRELRRDLHRSRRAIADASSAIGEPDDDQIAALEEALWRLAAATEKLDAVIAIAFGATAIELYDARARGIRFRPSFDENKLRLREIGSEEALRLREARARLEGERAFLRRNQLVHSLAPLVDLHDLVCFTLVLHRDGRVIPGGYELRRLGPERWDEGVQELGAEVLFARRLLEAERAYEALLDCIAALVEAMRANGRIRVPQPVFRDEETKTLALEKPAPSGPVPSFNVEFILGRDEDAERRVVDCSYKMAPGLEIHFGDGPWRVIEVKDGDGDPIDQVALCIRR
jgi:hypothetical protein